MLAMSVPCRELRKTFVVFRTEIHGSHVYTYREYAFGRTVVSKSPFASPQLRVFMAYCGIPKIPESTGGKNEAK